MNKIIYLILLSISISLTSNGQSWYEMRENGENFYQIRAAYDAEFAQSQNKRVNKPFERWAHRMGEVTYPTGEMSPNIPNYYLLRKEMAKNSRQAKSTAYPQWENLGPSVVPFGGGNGRLNFIKFRPDSLNVIFVGAPAGGLWKSTDGGQVFNLINDTLPVLGCSDLAIDPTNTDIMYLATGDRDGGDSYSIGVLKSFDGGLTWDTTGLQWSPSDTKRIGRLDINPQNPQMIVAATSVGLYKSEDGGSNWVQKESASSNDVHFKPGDSSIIYLSGNGVMISTDVGETFTTVISPSSAGRMEIAVTDDDPNYAYALVANSSGGLHSVWRSTNSGQSWTMRYSPGTGGKNLLTWDADGNGGGGQGWYDLALASSPIDKDHIVVGGINVWESTNGGASFGVSSISHWTGNGATYIHADQHDLVFKPNTNHIYAANDGGIFYTTDNGSIWTDLTGTLQITQSYRLGISQNTPGFMQAGNQDNGTIRRQVNGSFDQVNGGDGMETIIDHTNDNITYAATQNGNIGRAVGSTYSNILNNVNESGYWETPYIMDPFQNNVLYAGFNNIYKTSNADDPNPGSIQWVKRNNSSFPSAGKTTQLAIAPWNLDMLMASKGSSLYLSSDGGVNWSTITGPWTKFISNIQFSPYFNPGTFTAYVTLSQWNNASNDKRVFKTVDGGTSWTDISAGIPNVPTHCIVIDPTTFTTEELYVGTDIGVFYKNQNMTEFEPYSVGLPNVWVQEMEVQVNEGYIYACTYGRGLWKVPLMSTVVGLEQEKLAKNNSVELSVYPNPFKDRLEIKYDLKEKVEVQMEIIDLQGKVIYSHYDSNPSLGLNALNIDSKVAELQSGMYILKFRTGDEEITEKILKN